MNTQTIGASEQHVKILPFVSIRRHRGVENLDEARDGERSQVRSRLRSASGSPEPVAAGPSFEQPGATSFRGGRA